MPEKQQGIARFPQHKSLAAGVLAVCGVLLVFLGVWSKVPITIAFAFGIGALLFYAAYEVYRSKAQKIIPNAADKKFEEIEDELYSKQITELAEVTAPVQQQKHQRHMQAADFVEESPKITMSNLEPQSEFNNLLLKVLRAVKEVCFAHTVAFFWVNQESRHLVTEAKVTDSESFISERKIALSNDVVSRIGLRGQPEVINDISSDSERDILRYYKSLQSVRSFIGVPVFYVNDVSAASPIAVLVLDSKAQDAFGEETFSILAHFSKLISAMLISHTEKFDLFADVKLIEANSRLKNKINAQPSVSVVVNSLTEELENILQWDSISVILFDESQHSWVIATVKTRGTDKFISAKQLIDVHGSVVGRSLLTNTVQQVPLADNTQTIFHSGEAGSELLKQGSLVVVPFTSNGKCFGAVVASHRTIAFSKKDISSIQFLASTVAPEFEIIELNSIVDEHVVIDDQTGTFTRKFFLSRLDEELERSTDREEDLSLVFVSLSNVADIEMRYGPEGKDAAVVSVAHQLRSSVRPYDIVARFDDSTFGLILADTIANDAFLWAEKLRTAISSSIITHDKKSYSVSVTIGISGATASIKRDELIKNVTHVLDQALRSGGNTVRVF
ncbi:MAG: diguanylate cyclase [Bacteroidota bacterium]|nr:diguanylate cyclase [Bacteroidota bacterium]